MAKKGGRPKVDETKKKLSYIRFRCLEDEKKQIALLSKTYGLSMTDYILKKALDKKLVTNHVQLLGEIHTIGTELARSGNNINQLAKHANTLNKTGNLNQSILGQLNVLLENYQQQQNEIRTVFRKIIRELNK